VGQFWAEARLLDKFRRLLARTNEADRKLLLVLAGQMSRKKLHPPGIGKRLRRTESSPLLSTKAEVEKGWEELYAVGPNAAPREHFRKIDSAPHRFSEGNRHYNVISVLHVPGYPFVQPPIGKFDLVPSGFHFASVALTEFVCRETIGA
jgi:hypothetical protein